MKRVWNRRDFVQMICTAAVASRSLASTLFALPKPTTSSAGFLYVGSETNAIHVLAEKNGQWKSIQRVDSAQPVSVTVAPDGRTLYAVNEISQYRGLPMGTVEAYAIGGDGRLVLLNRQEISLSATMPRHGAISHDGRNLVVTAHGGGIYNVLPIASDGSIGRVKGILKVTGDVEGRDAKPAMAVFDKGGRVISVERGTGQLRVLVSNDEGLSTRAVTGTASGDSVRHVALHHEANVLYVAHEHSLECYGYDHEAGCIDELKQRIPDAGIADGAKALAVHPSGRLLLACDKVSGLAAWKIGRNGTLRFAGRHAREVGLLDSIEVAPDGASLIAINHQRGEVTSVCLDAVTGQVSGTRLLAQVGSPRSLAVIYS